MTQTRTAKCQPLDAAGNDDSLFSADRAVTSPATSLRRAATTVGPTGNNHRQDDEDEGAPRFDIPDVQIIGTIYKLSVQIDARGAVLVAYSRDTETGSIGRSFLRFDRAGAEYIRRRLSEL
ncbi:hypothetical protein ACFVZD_46150 [Streptomyces sp. NPDC058287]|uniref:hypothetical protein n=1 Tax=Streptomyces sp. NPDC058287 TaxID=3346423 RepID=UPI0036E346CE